MMTSKQFALMTAAFEKDDLLVSHSKCLKGPTTQIILYTHIGAYFLDIIVFLEFLLFIKI